MKGSDGDKRANESPMDRMIRLGRALFADKKDELPKRERGATPKRQRAKRGAT